MLGTQISQWGWGGNRFGEYVKMLWVDKNKYNLLKITKVMLLGEVVFQL